MIYIYILIDPRDNSVRYVGRTRKLKERFKNHCNPLHNKTSAKRGWIDEIIASKSKPILEVLEECEDREESSFWERHYTDLFRSWGFDLLNNKHKGFGNQTSFRVGDKPWNDGTGNIEICEVCGKEFRAATTAERRFCSLHCTSVFKSKNPNSGTFKKGFIPWNKGVTGYKLK